MKKFTNKVGFSDHSLGFIKNRNLASMMAVYLGAEYIERHITLDRAMWGTDQAASLSPAGLKSLVIMIKKIQIILGDGKKKILKDELHKSRELRYW